MSGLDAAGGPAAAAPVAAGRPAGAAAAGTASHPAAAAALDVRMFTVGPVQENAYVVRADSGSERALLIDPGEEPRRLLEAVAALGVEIEAILITHCHFDHIGAVAPLARATGAPVYCPQIEAPLLKDIMMWTPPGFGPFENWEPEHTLAGGEHLSLAGVEIEVLFTPGHSPGHVTYAIGPAARTRARAAGPADEQPTSAPGSWAARDTTPVLLSGDVLFQGSVGRTDLPGGDWSVLERSIATLVERFPGESTIYPGHMGVTTLGRELQSNPFLAEIRASRAEGAGVVGAAPAATATSAAPSVARSVPVDMPAR